MNETANTRLLRLELENRKLREKLEEAHEGVLIDNATRTVELEKENSRLSKKVQDLQHSGSQVCDY